MVSHLKVTRTRKSVENDSKALVEAAEVFKVVTWFRHLKIGRIEPQLEAAAQILAEVVDCDAAPFPDETTIGEDEAFVVAIMLGPRSPRALEIADLLHRTAVRVQVDPPVLPEVLEAFRRNATVFLRGHANRPHLTVE